MEVDFGKNTWGQLEEYLVGQFDGGLGGRDMRCEGFVVMRNCGRIWRNNKDKLLNFNHNLIRTSKTGPKIMTITYLRLK